MHRRGILLRALTATDAPGEQCDEPARRACSRSEARRARSSSARSPAPLLGGITGEAVAIALISLGAIAIVSLVFLEVGLSEDRERARERTQRRGAARAARRAAAADAGLSATRIARR